MSKLTDEEIKQYLKTQTFLLNELQKAADEVGLSPHTCLWQSLKVILQRVDSTKRFFKLYDKFATEEAIRLAERSNDPLMQQVSLMLKGVIDANPAIN